MIPKIIRLNCSHYLIEKINNKNKTIRAVSDDLSVDTGYNKFIQSHGEAKKKEI